MNDRQTVVPSGTLFIDGAWTKGTATFPVTDKFSGAVAGTAERASKEQVDRAVAAARRSFETVQLEPYDRYRILMKASQLIEERRDSLVDTIVAKPGSRSRMRATR
jgi:acyl-CoA reductase-like NAD-dependent aldehyde dehydrogenase